MTNLAKALENLNAPLKQLGQAIDDIYARDEKAGIHEDVTEGNIREIVRKAICELYAPDEVTLAFYALATVSCEVQELLALMHEVAAQREGKQNDD